MSGESTPGFCKSYARNNPNGSRAFQTGNPKIVSVA